MTWIAFRFAVHQGPSPKPFALFRQTLARCAQVLPQPARSLPIHGGAHLHKAKSEARFSRSCRLRPPLVKTCAHRAKKVTGADRPVADGKLLSGTNRPVADKTRPICEDSPPPSARLPWRAQQKPRPQPAESQDGRFRATRGLTYWQILSTAVRFSRRRDAALPAAPSHVESNRCYDILEQLRRFT